MTYLPLATLLMRVQRLAELDMYETEGNGQKT